MLRIDSKHKTVQESPPLGGGAIKELIHRRCQPHYAEVVGERGCRADAFAVDAAFADRRGIFTGRWIDTGAERCKAEHAFDLSRDRPRAIPFGESKFFHGGAPEPATRC